LGLQPVRKIRAVYKRDQLLTLGWRHSCPLTENSYPDSTFDGRVSRHPFPDHHAPPLATLALAAREIGEWLNGGADRVVVMHCKGVNRTSSRAAPNGVLRSDALQLARVARGRLLARTSSHKRTPYRLRSLSAATVPRNGRSYAHKTCLTPLRLKRRNSRTSSRLVLLSQAIRHCRLSSRMPQRRPRLVPLPQSILRQRPSTPVHRCNKFSTCILNVACAAHHPRQTSNVVVFLSHPSVVSLATGR